MPFKLWCAEGENLGQLPSDIILYGHIIYKTSVVCAHTRACENTGIVRAKFHLIGVIFVEAWRRVVGII